MQKRKIEGGVAAITGRREGKAKERRRKGEDEVTREGRKRLRGIRMDEPPAAEVGIRVNRGGAEVAENSAEI